MASRNFLVEGLDLTGLPGDASNAQINQSIRESIPATDLGWHIKSEDTPSVATNSEYATFLWTKPSTDETKYWNGTSWQLIRTQATIADGTIAISKLIATGGAVGDIIQVNGSNGFSFTTVAAAIAANSIAASKLSNAADAGYILLSGVGGVFATAVFDATADAWLATTNIPAAQVYDVAGVGLPNQVACITDTFNPLVFKYADQLLRANQVTTDRLKFAVGSANKYPRVNAGGTDFDYVVNPTTVGTSVLKYTVAKGTAGQAIVAASSPVVVEWTHLVDPASSAFATLDTATDQFTLLTGTYLLDISVPFNYSASGDQKFVLELYDVTGGTTLVTATQKIGSDDDILLLNIKHVLTIAAASNVYSVRVYTDINCNLGLAANLSTYAETYQQMSILKVA